MTRTPASSSAGASSAAALSGSARNTRSASRASAAGSSGLISPVKMCASAGSFRVALSRGGRGRRDNRDARMPREDAQQLLARVSSGAGHGDSDSFRRRRRRSGARTERPYASERIFIQCNIGKINRSRCIFWRPSTGDRVFLQRRIPHESATAGRHSRSRRSRIAAQPGGAAPPSAPARLRRDAGDHLARHRRSRSRQARR